MQNKDTKNFIKFSIIILSLLFIFAAILYLNKADSKEDDEIKSQWIECGEIGQGFIYYNGEFYYKNKNFCLMDENDVGDSIGVNERHLKKSDIENNKFLYQEENICAYAVYKDTPIYKCKKRDDILLVRNEEYMWNGYYIYIKDVPYSESSKKASLKYYIDNQNDIASYSLVSYGKNEIPVNINLSDFFNNENNSYSFATSNIQEGFMTYYLFIENDDIYAWFKGRGNVLSDYMIIDSIGDGKTTQYVYKCDGLKDVLIDMYSDFFGINNSIEDIDTDILFNQSDNTETTKESSENFYEDEETYDTGKTQSDLAPLK